MKVFGVIYFIYWSIPKLRNDCAKINFYLNMKISHWSFLAPPTSAARNYFSLYYDQLRYLLDSRNKQMNNLVHGFIYKFYHEIYPKYFINNYVKNR